MGTPQLRTVSFQSASNLLGCWTLQWSETCSRTAPSSRCCLLDQLVQKRSMTSYGQDYSSGDHGTRYPGYVLILLSDATILELGLFLHIKIFYKYPIKSCLKSSIKLLCNQNPHQDITTIKAAWHLSWYLNVTVFIINAASALNTSASLKQYLQQILTTPKYKEGT